VHGSGRTVVELGHEVHVLTTNVDGMGLERVVPSCQVATPVFFAEGLRIANRVRILPRTVMGSEKEHLFAAAQLLVLSSYLENLPIGCDITGSRKWSARCFVIMLHPFFSCIMRNNTVGAQSGPSTVHAK
jgi:hypothetical protein